MLNISSKSKPGVTLPPSPRVTIPLSNSNTTERMTVDRKSSEAYMENGQYKLAIANYNKSLELNPSNTSAKEKLKEIEVLKNGTNKPQ